MKIINSLEPVSLVVLVAAFSSSSRSNNASNITTDLALNATDELFVN
jgi:hypothetical protein